MIHSDTPHFQVLCYDGRSRFFETCLLSQLGIEAFRIAPPPAIPTSDITASTAASPAFSEIPTLLWVECDHSAVVTLVHMGGSFSGISTSIPTLEVVKAIDSVPDSNSSEPILLPSTRIEVSRAADRATLDAAIEWIYLRLDLQQAYRGPIPEHGDRIGAAGCQEPPAG